MERQGRLFPGFKTNTMTKVYLVASSLHAVAVECDGLTGEDPKVSETLHVFLSFVGNRFLELI